MNAVLSFAAKRFSRKPPPPEVPPYVITWIKQGDSMTAILPFHMRNGETT